MRARRHASRTSPGATESAPVCHEASVGAGLRGFPCTGIVKLEEAAQTTPDKKAAALTLLPVTMEGMQFSVPLSASSVPVAKGSHCRMGAETVAGAVSPLCPALYLLVFEEVESRHQARVVAWPQQGQRAQDERFSPQRLPPPQ